MKIWFDHCLNFTESSDCPVKLGLNWYKHYNSNTKFKSWNGFSITLHFFKWTIVFNAVDDFDAYDKKINYWKYRIKK